MVRPCPTRAPRRSFRQIQVIAGQTTQVHVRLAPRAAGSPLGPAERAVNEGVDALRKKVFRSVPR